MSESRGFRNAAPLLYNELAWLWSVFSPPEEYLEEVETFRRRFRRHGIVEGSRILHLGSGGGSIDYHLKHSYHITGVELSQQMIEQAERINPEVEYVQGDMTSLQLGRSFDAVLVHDAVSYMTSIQELERVYRTAADHLRAGGLMLALPEELKSRVSAMQPTVEKRVAGNVVLHVMTTHYDADPSDNTYETVYVFLIREREEVRVVMDRHVVGAFELDDFLFAIRKAGFTAQAERWELSEWGDAPELPLITAIKTS